MKVLRLPLVLPVLALTVPAQSVAAAPPGRETFTAYAVDISSNSRRASASSSHVKITVDRWSTDDERDRLVSAFAEGGSDALMKELKKRKPLGQISTATSTGYVLRFAHQSPTATGGRRILIATDRPIGYMESRNRARSIDYPYTVVEMRLDATGNGQGKMTVAAKVNAFGDTIELENYGRTPVQLSNVHVDKK